MTSVVWFRRDIRLGDHLALVEAAGQGPVVPLPVLDPALLGPAGKPRIAFLYRCLRALDTSIGGRLVVRHGDPVEVVPAVAAEAGARRVSASWDGGPYGSTRDDRVAAARGRQPASTGARRISVCRQSGGARLQGRRTVQGVQPLLPAWQAHGWGQPVPEVAVQWRAGFPTDGIPDDPPVDASLPPAGEAAALARLEAFLAGPVDDYAGQRDRPAADATSRLSPYLKYGCIRPRTILARLGRAQPGADGRRQLPRQRPPHRLDPRRPVVHGAAGRRRPGVQQPRLAVGGRHRHRPAPYFRIFNPVTQGKEHDPAGDYVRRWVPELASVAGAAVHEPWKQPGGVPAGYPERIVDHAAERAQALSRYESLKSRH